MNAWFPLEETFADDGFFPPNFSPSPTPETTPRALLGRAATSNSGRLVKGQSAQVRLYLRISFREHGL